MFLGTYLVSVTSGKRVAVPSPFRKHLGEKAILAQWYENCLVLVGSESWSALLERLTGGEKMAVTPVRQTERFIFASAYEVVFDEQGRMVLPDKLVAYAGLGESVYFLGVNDKVEIWSKEIWERESQKVEKEAGSYIEKLANDTAKYRLNEKKTR